MTVDYNTEGKTHGCADNVQYYQRIIIISDNEELMIEGIIKWGEMDTKSRGRVGKENRQYIIDNFSSEIIAKRYKKLFVKITGNNL